MKSSGRGYTILEVMLFLAITGALFVSAYFLMNGQQAKTQFSQGMRDIESKFRDYINDVSTGYYPQVGEYSCDADASGVSFSQLLPGSGDTTGRNLSCIFLGKAIQIQPDTGNDWINVYSVVGRRKVDTATGGRDVKDYIEAEPTAVVDANINLDKTESYQIPWGVRVRSVQSVPGNDSRLLAIYSSLSRTSTVTPGTNESGALVLQPVPYNITAGNTKTDAIQCINDTVNCAQLGTAFEYWRICFESAEGNQTAELTVGGDGKKTNLTLEFKGCS